VPRSVPPAPPPTIAPDDPDWYLGDVHAAYEWLRRESPVHRYEPNDCWLVSRYEDVRRVSRDPATFCSGRGILVHDPVRAGRTSPTTILQMDPPEHTAYRKLVSRAFTPGAVRRLETRVRELVRESLADVADRDVVDFVEEVAVPVPVLVIAEILGVPASDRADFRRWSDAAILAADDYHGGAAGVLELFSYFGRHLEEHRARPRDDVLSQLLAAEVDGRRLTDLELQSFCLTLLVAGNETTRNLVSGGALALAEHPHQRALLAAEPARIAAAVDEMLRWVTPVKTFARTATRDTDLGGRPVAAGDYLLLLYAAANRDEAAFGPTAGRFDVTRPTDPAHVAFGFGEHYCLGAHLARLEARVLFEELLARHPHFELAAEPEPMRSTLMHGMERMPVRLAA
jgi:cytochrome P450